MNNEKGFTLVEVLASLVIITIVLLSFSKIFIQNNDYANLNTEKLVVVNLADGYLERLRVERELLQHTRERIREGSSIVEKIRDDSLILNERTYPVEVTIISSIENNMKLQNVVVTVFTEDRRSSASVEGYIAYE